MLYQITVLAQTMDKSLGSGITETLPILSARIEAKHYLPSQKLAKALLLNCARNDNRRVNLDYTIDKIRNPKTGV